MSTLLVKQFAYRIAKYILWQLWAGWKKENKQIVKQFNTLIDWVDWGAVGTIDDGFWGWTNESQYKWGALPFINRFTKVYDQREFQNIIWGVGCFGYGNLNNATLNLWIEFTKKDRENFTKDLVKTDWYKPQWGGYFSKGADVVNNYLNKNKVEYMRYYFSVNLYVLNKVLDQGYHVSMPINISQEVLNWLFDNWVLEASEISWSTSFGHLMNIAKNNEWKVVLWIDNYPETKEMNVFEIESLETLYRSGKFMKTARFYAPIKDMKKIGGNIEEVKLPWVVLPKSQKDNYKLAVDMWFISDIKPNESITRKEAGIIAGRVYTKVAEHIAKYISQKG